MGDGLSNDTAVKHGRRGKTFIVTPQDKTAGFVTDLPTDR